MPSIDPSRIDQLLQQALALVAELRAIKATLAAQSDTDALPYPDARPFGARIR